MSCVVRVIALMVLVVSIEGSVYKKRRSLDAYKTNRLARGTLDTADSGVLDLLFQFGDSNDDKRLNDTEVRELFCGRLFAANIHDIVNAIMERASDKIKGLNQKEWRSIQFSDEELESFKASPYITILS